MCVTYNLAELEKIVYLIYMYTTMLRLLLLVVGTLAYDTTQYDRYTLIRYIPTPDHIGILDIIRSAEGIHALGVAEIGVTNEILVSPEKLQEIDDIMRYIKLSYNIGENTLPQQMTKEWDRMLARGYPDKMVYDINDFNTLADIDLELSNLATQCAPGVTCSVASIGQSFNGNDMNLFSISSGAGRPAILMDSMTHPNEWLAAATLMNILDKMVKEYTTDVDVARLVDNYDFYFLPVNNPDGYNYTWTNERSWFKNRRDNDNSTCFGVQVNRNHDARWSTAGGSFDPCSDQFYGAGPTSEPEAQNLVNFVLANPAIVNYITFHASGYYLSSPYGNCTRPVDWNDKLWPVMREFCQGLELAEPGNQWECGNTCNDFSPTSGTAMDWMMDTVGMTYALMVGLRGASAEVPPSEIPQSLNETWTGLVGAVDEMIQQGAQYIL